MSTPDGNGLVEAIMAANDAWATESFPGMASRSPSRHLVVLTCMDSRIDVFEVLGLKNGEAHIIRNAGAMVTDDVQRSIALSQRYLGTVDVVLIQHTDCGMGRFDAGKFRRQLLEETGEDPGWDVEGFDDVDESVRTQLGVLATSPWLRHDGQTVGLVYECDTGRLRYVAEVA
jgi:carbonic anhydrase